MKQTRDSLMDGLKALPAFPLVFVTVADNIMVAAAFHFYSYDPPSIMVGIKPEKYTHELIKDKKEFGISIPSLKQFEEVKICGSNSGRTTKKFELSQLTRRESKEIDSMLIEECPVNLACKVVHEVDYPGSHTWFIGEIKEVHLDSEYRRSDALMFWFSQFRALGKVVEGLEDKEIFDVK